MKILVVAPHPDDEILGCGGSILKHIAKGDEVSVLFVTNGGNLSTEGTTRKLREKGRIKEARKACKTMGVKNILFLKETERFLTYSASFLKKAIGAIRKCAPDLVYLPHPQEMDHDHKVTYEVFYEACWIAASSISLGQKRTKKTFIKEIRQYEVWTPMHEYNISIDISNQMLKKLEAMGCYKSQLQVTRYDLAIKALNFYRATMNFSGHRYVEVFNVVRMSNC